MKVSIAVAVYNGEKYVVQQLDSLRKQTRPADEVIIADDCSTDSTFETVAKYIEKYKLKHWILYKNKGNLGYRENFLHCIEKTTGDIIFLCDQDDIWKKEKLECMIKQMEKEPGILVLNTAISLIDEKNQKIRREKIPGHSNENIINRDIQPGKKIWFPLEDMIKCNISPGCTVAFRSSIREKLLEKQEVFRKSGLPHDWFINILGALEHGTCFWNKVFIGYRIHSLNTLGLADVANMERIRYEGKSFGQIRCMQNKEQKQNIETARKNAELLKQDKIVKLLDKEIVFFESRQRALEKRDFLKFIKCVWYWILGNARDISWKVIAVDGLYVLGIKYH